MVWTMRTVFMMIPDSGWSPGGRFDPPEPLPFTAFKASALGLACPFAIVRSPSLPFPPRRRRVRAA
jgi:hypothetical protein